MDLAVDMQLAQAARDQLRHLAAEVDDEQTLVMAGGGGDTLGHGVGLRQDRVRAQAEGMSLLERKGRIHLPVGGVAPL